MRTGLAAGLRKHGGLGLRQVLGLWHPEQPLEDALLQRLSYEGLVVFDVGGFEGIHTIFFADRVGPEGRVIAFEPHPGNAARISKNVEVNGMGNVEVRQAAVGAQPGELTLHVVSGDTGRSTADPDLARSLRDHGTSPLAVPVTTIDIEVADGAPAPDFVKIDVEGLEAAVLAGMAETLERHRPAVFVELHGASADAKTRNAQAVARRLLEAGYSVRHVETDQLVQSHVEAPPRGHLYAVAR